jgi:hypothetical protein
MGKKTQNLLKRLQNTQAEKVANKKATEKLSFFTFITVCESFGLYTFLCEFLAFWNLFQWIRTRHRLLILNDIHIENFGLMILVRYFFKL